MRFELTHESDRLVLDADRRPDGWSVLHDGTPLDLSILSAQPGEIELEHAGRRLRAYVAIDGARRLVHLEGRVYEFEVPDDDEDLEDDLAGGPNVTAEMPGTIVKVLVEKGQAVEAETPLLIIEAMKMESEIPAPVAGTVAAVHVAAGDVVKQDAPLIDLEPETDDAQ